MLVSEIFRSIQGESTHMGLSCVFIRLAGCNLKCGWCDTEYAQSKAKAKKFTIDQIVKEAKKYKCSLLEITGGEPLMQDEARPLATRLLDAGFKVLLETNGTVCLSKLDPRLIKIVDVKCPSSGHGGSFLMDNLRHITDDDEVKFVIADRKDYEYAKRFIDECLKDITLKVLFAPVASQLNPKELAEWILKDCLKVRLQIQMHKYVWPDEPGR